jgi:glycogen(starch) synthase
VHILLLSWEYPPVVHGGLGRHVDALTRAQVAAGDTVGVLTLAGDLTGAPGARTSAAAQELVHGVEVRRVRTPVLADPVAGLTAAMAEVQERMRSAATGLRPDAVHAHDWMVADAARRIADEVGCPMVLTVHATELGRRAGRLDGAVPQAVHAAECRAVRTADRIVVCSTPMVAEVAAHGADPSVVRIVPGAVEAALWRTTAQQQHDARNRFRARGSPLLVAAGRLEWEKGFSTLLRALPSVLAGHRTGRVVLAGTGSYEPTLRALVGSLGLEGTVDLPGRLSTTELAALFATADAVVVPSRYEPFGLVALEAQAAGAVVVATSVGGLSEIVEDERTGLLFGPGDVDGLGRLLNGLLDDGPGSGDLRAAALATAAARPWSAVAEALRSAYR